MKHKIPNVQSLPKGGDRKSDDFICTAAVQTWDGLKYDMLQLARENGDRYITRRDILEMVVDHPDFYTLLQKQDPMLPDIVRQMNMEELEKVLKPVFSAKYSVD